MRPITDNNSLIEWLEKQPPEGHYAYRDGHNCLLAQYFQSMGLPHAAVSMTDWYPSGVGAEGINPLPAGWDTVARGNNFMLLFQTYGGALERARQLPH